MSSRTLYPPIVNSYEPAFVAGSSSQLRVYFSLSSLSSIPNANNLTVHASILRKDGIKVLNTDNDVDAGRYRATGIILNLVPQRDLSRGDNSYYVTINNSDLKSSVTLSGTTFNGWIPGWTYKIQLRLSTVTYPGGNVKQAAWLQEQSSNFSEWSTICYTKAISEMSLQIPLFGFDSADKTQPYDPRTIHSLSDFVLFGSLESSIKEANEDYDYVIISLYKNEELLESSGEIFKTELSESYFSYVFKTKIQENEIYELKITYKTENGYMPYEPYQFMFLLDIGTAETIDAEIVTVETDTHDLFEDISSIEEEEEEGRIGLKIYSDNPDPFSGNICIRRASAEDNFATWEDIKIFVLKEQVLNDFPIFYDYTIQSGVWYKYGIQGISTQGLRTELVEMQEPVQRLFQHSYLLGMNDKQLKLNFNNDMNSFKIQVLDSKTETIGGVYPFINRNAAVRYRTFPLNGLISFWMDENQTFLKNGKKDVYEFDSIVEDYEAFNIKRGIMQNDYTYERDFRKIILDFLIDGKPKLFKSPSEGNIIIRLMDVNCSPDRTTDKMIYSFTSTANEIDEATMANYLKYGFYNPGTYGTDFSIHTTYLGQLDGSFKTTDNIFKLIYDKYDSQDRNYAGFSRKLEKISRVKITINDPPLRVRNNNGDLVVGNNFRLTTGGSTSVITIYDPRGIYEFDELINFFYYGTKTTGNDALYLLGDADGSVTEVNATIDFLYSLSISPYVKHEQKERKSVRGVGQFYEEVAPDTSIYNSIYYKYYIESSSKFRYLSTLNSIEIEANPHTVFAIKDAEDDEIQYHEINDTGVLRLYELSNIEYLTYVGKRYETDLYDDSSLSNNIIKTDVTVKDIRGNDITIKAATDVSVTYRYTVIEGYYKE